MLVSKDNDLRRLSVLHGAPPKVVWLSVGDAGIAEIARLLIRSAPKIRAFFGAEEESLLVIER